MHNKRVILLTGFFVLLISAFLVSAEIDYKNIDISKSYGPGQIVEGSFNLKLTEEPSSSELKVVIEQADKDIEKKIEILDFLKASNVNFTCSTEDCKANYSIGASNGEKTLKEGTNYVGLVIPEGNNTQGHLFIQPPGYRRASNQGRHEGRTAAGKGINQH